jgi:hypothetical protein
MRPQLVVIAPDPAEVVRSAGGWLCDRAMAGWDVGVLTEGKADPRPLRILGARSFDLEAVLASPVRGPHPQAIAVSAELFASDHRIRRMVCAALDDGVTDCRLWVDHSTAPHDETDEADHMRHRPSAAARAFKAQALAALPTAGNAGEFMETFRRAELLHPSRSA